MKLEARPGRTENISTLSSLSFKPFIFFGAPARPISLLVSDSQRVSPNGVLVDGTGTHDFAENRSFEFSRESPSISFRFGRIAASFVFGLQLEVNNYSASHSFSLVHCCPACRTLALLFRTLHPTTSTHPRGPQNNVCDYSVVKVVQ